MTTFKLTSGQTVARKRHKLKIMINDLKRMKEELLPDDKKQSTDLSSYDEWRKKKHELNAMLSGLRTAIQMLEDKRSKAGKEVTRDLETIRLQNEMSTTLENAVKLFTELKDQLQKDARKTFGKKLSEEQLADRSHICTLLGEELADLTRRARSTDSGAIQSDEISAMSAHVERRREELRKKREEARRKRNNRRNSRTDPFDSVTTTKSEQEQIFEEQAAVNTAQQDEMLDQVSKGLDELKVLSLDMNKQLKVQHAMLEQVDTKMDKVIHQVNTANRRLKGLLEENGGLTRWIPVILCLVVLLALLGYIFHIV